MMKGHPMMLLLRGVWRGSDTSGSAIRVSAVSSLVEYKRAWIRGNDGSPMTLILFVQRLKKAVVNDTCKRTCRIRRMECGLDASYPTTGRDPYCQRLSCTDLYNHHIGRRTPSFERMDRVGEWMSCIKKSFITLCEQSDRHEELRIHASVHSVNACLLVWIVRVSTQQPCIRLKYLALMCLNGLDP